jgi:aldose sugar dehydrogenase
MKTKMTNYLVLLSLVSVNLYAQNSGSIHSEVLPDTKTVEAELINDELKNPWGMAFLPNGDLLVTEKTGEIVLLRDGIIINKAVKGGPKSKTQGQGGLLDIKLHPDFENNQWIYFTFASDKGKGKGAMTAFSRAKWNGEGFEKHKVLYKGSPNTKKGQHFGSRITFDNEGYVYFSIGDRGNRDENPQDITRDGGKIYRLNADGSIPNDNPFVGQSGAREAIFSYGHRNPQGLATHPVTGDVWESEHGPQGGDEINLIGKGKNYGWPVISYGINYSGTTFTDITEKEGMEQPASYWDPSIAACGMTFLKGNAYPNWKNSLIVGSLKFSYLIRCDIEGGKVVRQEQIASGIGRVRSVIEGPDGLLYVGVEGKGLYKLVLTK